MMTVSTIALVFCCSVLVLSLILIALIEVHRRFSGEDFWQLIVVRLHASGSCRKVCNSVLRIFNGGSVTVSDDFAECCF